MKPKVFLGLPRLGQVEIESAIGAFVHATEDKCEVTIEPKNSSLLAFGFNNLWCQFLNGTYDYFALLHADIHPDGPWLDVLIEQLKGADAVHAVVAIKDNRGLTSTAIGSKNDGFSPSRRLTVREVQSLPDTFSLGDIQRLLPGPLPPDPCLLPNTGVFAVRRRSWCYDFPGFTINDSIAVDSNGLRYARAEPEDWGFGRWAAKKGLVVKGTSLIKTTHFGRASYVNYVGWGEWDQDKQYVDFHR